MAAISLDEWIACLIAVAAMLLLFHVNAERESFKAPPRWCLRALHNLKVHSEEVDHKKAMEIRRMVDEARIQNFKTVVRCSTILASIFIGIQTLVSSAFNIISDVFAWQLAMYAVAMCCHYSQIRWTPIKVTAVMTLANLMILTCTCMIANPGVWLLQSQTRAALRLVSSFGDMNHFRAAMWNMLFLVVNVIKTLKFTEDFPALQRPLPNVLIPELAVFVMVWLTSYSTEICVTDSVRTAFEASASRVDKTMTDHLLSAFCDAQAKLGPDLQILGCHKKLHRILLSHAPIENCPLEGTSFLDYVAIADKARFKAFIEACSAPSDRCFNEDSDERPKPLPSALHVHLRNSSGHYLPASIFHSAATIADGESHHLIGICVDTSGVFTETADQDRQVYHDCDSHESSKKRSSSLSSRSSCSSASSSAQSKKSVCLVGLPLIETVSVVFSSFTWSIRTISYNLSHSDSKVPIVADCMLQPDGYAFSGWAQDQINNYHQPLTEDDDSDQECHLVSYGSIAMILPNIFHDSRPIIISAESAWLDLKGLGHAEEDDEYGLVSLNLEGVQQLLRDKRPKAVMSTIKE